MQINTLVRRTCISVLLVLSSIAYADAGQSGNPVGIWYLALDVEPYGLPENLNLPGLVMINREGTGVMQDGGDFGAFPFERDSAQFVAWRRVSNHVRMNTLFMQAQASTGDVLAWWKVRLNLEFTDADTLKGFVRVFKLDCIGPAPLGFLNCPDPITAADDFVEQPPIDIPIPVVLRRYKAGS